MSLQALLSERIARDGPIPFAAFMSQALYHPRLGYYARGPERSGWRGHFLTSPELDPAFGELWAKGLEQIWTACGMPSSFDVFEVGPGEGGLAASVMDSVDSPMAEALTYRLIERIPALERRQRARLGDRPHTFWYPSLSDAPRAGSGCVLANEVLDNLPVHVVEVRNGGLHEMRVDVRGTEFVSSWHPPSSPELERYLQRTGMALDNGQRAEIGLAAESFVRLAAGRIDTGALVFVDYGMSVSELSLRPAGTLIAYSASGVDDRVLQSPGEKDITSHVNWTAVAAACEAAGFTVATIRPQREVLKALGADELEGRLKAEHERALAESRGADAVAFLSRRQALGALTDPGGLGGLDVVVAFRGTSAPAFARGQNNSR